MNETTNRSNTNLLIFGGIGALLLCICLGAAVVGVATGLIAYRSFQTGTSQPITTFETAVPVGPVPTIIAEPPPPETVAEVIAELEAAEIPPRDRYDLAARFLGVTDAQVTPPGEYQVGDREEFWVENGDTEEVLRIEAELKYRNDVLYMWVEVGQEVDENAMINSADRFAEEVYPLNHEYFGTESSPGIDGDPRLHVLHTTVLGTTTAGYFYSPSEYPEAAVPYSNEKEIFFINISNTLPGNPYYDVVLAHEFQHMIHWAVDRNEEGWLNEGLSELAAFLNGFGPSGFVPSYMINPDHQLNSWPEDGDTTPNYGAGFLFATYFLDRFGEDALKALVAHEANGFHGIDETLAEAGENLTANDVFADWVIANYLNDTDIAPEFGYESLDTLQPPEVAEVVNSYPHFQQPASVHQFGVDYIVLEEAGDVTFRFEGSQQVRIAPTSTQNTDEDPDTADSFVWWSNRADDSDTHLTRQIDLTDVSAATLEYDLWYLIEDEYDYGYVAVSTDGERWTALETTFTTTNDPHGNAYGPGYTGRSADNSLANGEGWVQESVDLSEYAGSEIYIRFELISDDAVNQPGMAIDNICVPEIDWCDNVEAADSEWEANGWVRHNNLLPQTWSVRVIIPGDGPTEVVTLELDEASSGEVSFTVDPREPAVIVVSGTTRHTTELASYNYWLETD